MSKWVVYAAGNSSYFLSPHKEPIRMLRSFQDKFGDKLDYVYFTDINEPNLDSVKILCEQNNIQLITADVARHYEKYRDVEYPSNPRWPSAVYWYCDAPDYFYGKYDYAIKCDGDMLCVSDFDLSALETHTEITAAREPKWYHPYDKHCPNAGFQILNIKQYVDKNIKELFRQASEQYLTFNSDTPALDNFVATKKVDILFVGPEYNYLLFDMREVNSLTLADVSDVKIFHFVASKPHNLFHEMERGIKRHYANIYLNY
jgi:hypothetical protein